MESYQTCNLIPNSNRPEGLTRNRLKKKKGNVVPVLIKQCYECLCGIGGKISRILNLGSNGRELRPSHLSLFTREEEVFGTC
jgi:hypothetical protein